MFSWLVILTLMAGIAYFLLFPRADLVDLKDKPMDDVDAKQILMVHQAAVNLAKTQCDDGYLLYQKVGDTSPIYCSVGLSPSIKANNDFTPRAIEVKFFPIKTDTSHRPLQINGQNIELRIACLDEETGDAVNNCDDPGVAAFVVTYVRIEGYTTDMPMLPYMLGKAFNFQYTGKPLKMNSETPNTYVSVNTYCGAVVRYDHDALPPYNHAGDRPPFLVNPAGADAISNTQHQIATIPQNIAGMSAGQDYAICVTPLNTFDGAVLTSKVHH